MAGPAGGQEQNALVGRCAWSAMAHLQYQARFEHRDAFTLDHLAYQVRWPARAPEVPMRRALELLQARGWVHDRDGGWSLTEAGRRLRLPPEAKLATLLGLDAAERTERTRRHREAISRRQEVVDTDLRALGQALAAGGLDPTGLAPLFPTVELRVYHLAVPSGAAFTAWQGMRDCIDETGFWPVVLGDPDDVALHAGQSERWLAEEPTAAESLAEAAATSPEAWLAARAREREADRLRYDLRDEPYPHGPWPQAGVQRRALRPPEGEIAHLALFPTPRGWEVAAYLRWFVGNAGLRPADHVRLQRWWAARYGAELVHVQDQAVAQFRVAGPPTDRDGALRLAVEHFEYCPDRVHQSTDAETLEALAAELMNAPVWYFWWD